MLMRVGHFDQERNRTPRFAPLRETPHDVFCQVLERVKGIEPSYSAWKAAALPLSYTRVGDDLTRHAGGLNRLAKAPEKPPNMAGLVPQTACSRQNPGRPPP